LGTAALLVLGTAIGARKTLLRQPPKQGLRLLSAAEYAVLCAAFDRICPALGNGAAGALALGVPERIDAMLAAAPGRVQRDVKSLLFIVENALVGALLLERVRPFTQLSAAEQDAVLNAMRHSWLPLRRAMFRALKGLCGGVYYGDERSWARIGYVAPSAHALRDAYAQLLFDFEPLRAHKG
jgi:hypothetical protein